MSIIRQFYLIIVNTDFKILLLNGVLSFLLFTGALHINLAALAKEKKQFYYLQL
tara:strand:- start:2024 stop:2185 length:162 start_codon:yes stop_codon:yes gene_type:complete